MNEIYVYHVVTEKPMVLGQQIIFNEEHHNGVYNRVMTCKKILDGENPQCDLADFIKLDLNKWTSVTFRELALEQVRQKLKIPCKFNTIFCGLLTGYFLSSSFSATTILYFISLY